MEQEQKLTADQIIKFLEERNFKELKEHGYRPCANLRTTERGIGKSASCGSCRCHGRTG